MNAYQVTIATQAQLDQAKIRHEILRLDLVLALLSCLGNGRGRQKENHSTIGAGEHLAWSRRHTGHWLPGLRWKGREYAVSKSDD